MNSASLVAARASRVASGESLLRARRVSPPSRSTPSRSQHTHSLNTYSRRTLTKQPNAALYSYAVLVILFFACISCALLGRRHARQLILRILSLLYLHFALPVQSRSAAPL